MPLVTVYKARRRRGIPACLRKAADDTADFGELADALVPQARRIFTRDLNAMWSDADIAALARSIRNQRIAAITQYIPEYDPKDPGDWQEIDEGFQGAMGKLLEQAGKKALASLGIGMAFRLDNPYTQRWLSTETGNLITNISNTARANVRSMMQTGWTEGIAPADMADLLRPILGLNEIQAGAVANVYQGHLDAGLDESEAAGKASDYASDLLDYRAETIARTETIAAENAGTHDAWNVAADKGYIDDDTQREWVASPVDAGACEDCAWLDGKRTSLTDPFGASGSPSGYGDVQMPPLHPRCRCCCRLILKGINDVAGDSDSAGDSDE